MSRYMRRFYGLSKDATQKLLDLAVEDNLIKLENKVGTKGTKSGVEERAYRSGHQRSFFLVENEGLSRS